MEGTFFVLRSDGKPAPSVNQAYKIAVEQWSHIGDITELCRKSGATCSNAAGSKSVIIEYLQRSYAVSLPDAEIYSNGSPTDLSVKEKLLILHYLLTANGTQPSGKLISFQELPEGHVYYPTFMKRSVQPLVSSFGLEPRLLVPPAENLGGKPAEFGDVSFTITAFPRVPLTVVLWRGDDEFEARGSILFDTGISNYLPTEDITILCETISWKLIRSKPIQ